MNTEFSAAQLAQYRDQGFVVQPGFLNAAELTELRDAVVAAVASMGKRKITGGELAMEEGDGYYDKVFTQRLNLWRICDTVKRHLLAPELGQALCTLTGVAGMRCWHDQALIKEPFGNPTAWHLDNPYWSFSSRDSVSIWIALVDATPWNGCMHFIPGSHKLAQYDNVGIGQDMAALFKAYPEMAEIDPVPAPMKAGDCSFHNGLTAHGAGANMTRERRLAMTCAYMPDGCTFNGTTNILPPSYMQTLKVGDVLDNDHYNPLLWRRA